jgi:cell division protein FtsZ
VIARATHEAKILTVGVVTKPFSFEGIHRMRLAEQGIAELQQHVDTLIVIPNQNLFRLTNEKTTFADAFRMADDVLFSGVRSITDLIVRPGLINLDFADIRSVMTEMGKAMMGSGEAEGENRALDAAEMAINNPLLDEVSLKGARGVLINITSDHDITLMEVDQATTRIREEVDPDANIIFGATYDESMSGKLRISVVATGIDAAVGRLQRPTQDSAEIKTAGDLAVTSGSREAKPTVGVRSDPAPVLAMPGAGLARSLTGGRASAPVVTTAEQVRAEAAQPQAPTHMPMAASATAPAATLAEPQMGAPRTDQRINADDAAPTTMAPQPIQPMAQATNTPVAPVAQAAPSDTPFLPPRPIMPGDVVDTRMASRHPEMAQTATIEPSCRPPSPAPQAATARVPTAPQRPRKGGIFGRFFSSTQRGAEEPCEARGTANRAVAKPPMPQLTMPVDRGAPRVPRAPVSKQTLARPMAAHALGIAPEGAESDGVGDQLEIPAFLRRQAN